MNVKLDLCDAVTSESVQFDNLLSPRRSTATLTMLWLTKFMINNRTDAWKTDGNLLIWYLLPPRSSAGTFAVPFRVMIDLKNIWQELNILFQNWYLLGVENISSYAHKRYLLGVPLNIFDECPRHFYMGDSPGLNVLLRFRNECHTTRQSLNSCCNVSVIFVKYYSSCYACWTRNVATHVAVSWRSTILTLMSRQHHKVEKLTPVLVNSVEIHELRE